MQKTIWALLLVFVLILGSGFNVVADVAAPGDEGYSVTEDPNVALDGTYPILPSPDYLSEMTMVMVSFENRTTPVSEMINMKWWEEETGVKFNWIDIPMSSYEEKINLMLASQELPDCFYNYVTREILMLYADQGIFLPTQYLTENYMPNLQKVYEMRPEYAAEATAPDGNRYGFPFTQENTDLILYPGPIYINVNWLDKVGLGMPETVDEWVEAMRAFKAFGDLNENGVDDEWPIGTAFAQSDTFGTNNMLSRFAGAFGQQDTYGGRMTDHLAVVDGKVIYSVMTDAYKEAVNLFSTLNAEGLIDPDSYSETLSLDKINTSEVPVLGSFPAWGISGVPEDYRDQYKPLPRLTGPDGAIGHKLNYSSMEQPCFGAITTACKYPEVVAAAIDWLNTPENVIAVNMGALGEEFSMYRDDSGFIRYNKDANGNATATTDLFENTWDLRVNTTMLCGPYTVLDEYYQLYGEQDPVAIDIVNDQIFQGRDELAEEVTSFPVTLLTTEEQSVVSRLVPTIKNTINQYTLSWVLDGGVDETWDTYLQDMNNAGVDQALEIYQQVYDRYLLNLPD